MLSAPAVQLSFLNDLMKQNYVSLSWLPGMTAPAGYWKVLLHLSFGTGSRESRDKINQHADCKLTSARVKNPGGRNYALLTWVLVANEELCYQREWSRSVRNDCIPRVRS